jgi:UDP-N-acetylmuramate--alanine ligase
MELARVKKAFFIGIGGIGMSALARYFKAQGIQVSGYDRYRGHVVKKLEDEGIYVCFEDHLRAVEDLDLDLSDSLIVYTPAVPADAVLLNYFRSKTFELRKRSEVLGMITRNSYCFAVAGTHGKTTTSALLTYILRYGEVDCTGFMGGIVSDFKSNLVIGKENITVVEADEYDRSFLHLNPDMAVITSMDADHLDIYGDEKEMHRSFHEFASGLKEEGNLLAHKTLPLSVPHETYSIDEKADYYAANIRVNDGEYCFDLHLKDDCVQDVEVGLPGYHNVENAVAAAAMAYQHGLKPKVIAEAIGKFKGVYRRFERHYKSETFVYIDDYAHHPEEIRMSLLSAREMYPERKLLVFFQPHLYSRTRDFAAAFAKSLDMADEVYLLDIYPARELPIPGVTNAIIGDLMKTKPQYITFETLMEKIAALDNALILTLGAGNIDEWVEPLVNMLKEKEA